MRKVGTSLVHILGYLGGGLVLSVTTVRKVGASLVHIQFTRGDLEGICSECWEYAQIRRVVSSG